MQTVVNLATISDTGYKRTTSATTLVRCAAVCSAGAEVRDTICSIRNNWNAFEDGESRTRHGSTRPARSQPSDQDSLRRSIRGTGRCEVDRLRLAQQLQVLQRYTQLLLQVLDRAVRSSDRVLLGLRVRVYRLQQRLVLHSLHPGFHHRTGQLPSHAQHRSRVVRWSVLRDVRPVSVQDCSQIVELRSIEMSDRTVHERAISEFDDQSRLTSPLSNEN